jgi:hypothetical protein
MVHAWWCFTTFLPAVREFLSSVFPALCVGRGGPTAWPARSSDLNPLDFYLWAHLKSTFWAAEVGDPQDWQQRIQNGFEMIRKTSGTLQHCQTYNVLRWSSGWKLWTFCVIFRGLQLGNRAS